MTRAERWRIVIRVTAVVAPIAAVLGLIPGWFLGDGTLRAVVTGGVIGFLIGAGMAVFDASWALGLIPRSWREAPFLVVLLSRSLVWLAIIVVGILVPLVTIGGVAAAELNAPEVYLSVAVSFLLALVVNFVGQVNRLLGRGILVSLILGRYHRPREEERIFLLVDVRGSTEIAERLGNLRYHAFLKRFVGDVTGPTLRYRTEIHRYVGDEVILTWKADQGRSDAACIRAVLAMTATLDRAAPDYRRDFGVEPRFWAALHIGPVVAGEIGEAKHEIVYLGDTLNTVARIEDVCRQVDRPFVASGDLVSAIELPSGIDATSLGTFDLKGVGEPVELFAIERTAPAGAAVGLP